MRSGVGPFRPMLRYKLMSASGGTAEVCTAGVAMRYLSFLPAQCEDLNGSQGPTCSP